MTQRGENLLMMMMMILIVPSSTDLAFLCCSDTLLEGADTALLEDEGELSGSRRGTSKTAEREFD